MDKDWLRNKYCCEQLSVEQIADLAKTKPETVRYWLNNFNITRPKSTKRSVRKRNRLAAIQFLGSKCSQCGYNTHIDLTLEFHHIDPSKKEFNISKGYDKAWKTLKSELRKCILLCSCCHKMADNGIWTQQELLKMKKNNE